MEPHYRDCDMNELEQSTSVTWSNIVYDSNAGLIVCLQCRSCITEGEDAFIQHCQRNHGKCTRQRAREVYRAVYPETPERPHEKEWYCNGKLHEEELHPLPEVKGVPVLRGMKCAGCPRVFGKRRTYRSHIAQFPNHIGEPRKVSVQSIWRCRKRSFFFPIASGQNDKESISNELTDLMDNDPCEESRDPREMCEFVLRMKPQIKLEALHISKEDAYFFSASHSEKQCVIEEGMRMRVVQSVRNPFAEAERMCRANFNFSRENVRRAIACPGVVRKNKIFNFPEKKTSEKYATLASRMILFIMRIRFREKNDMNKGVIEIKPSVLDACKKLSQALGENALYSEQFGKKGERRLRYGEGVDVDTYRNSREYRMHEEECEGNEKEGEEEMKLIYDIFRDIILEPVHVSQNNVPSIAECFTTCLLVKKSQGKLRYALGSEISPTLAAISHTASIVAIMGTWRWPRTGNADEELEMFRRMYQPEKGIALNEIISNAAKTRQTRSREEAVPSWISCGKHDACGNVFGRHLSMAELGAVIERIQDSIFEGILGCNGIFGNSKLSMSFLEDIRGIEDDPYNRAPNYCFLNHPKNERIVGLCRTAQTKVLQEIHVLPEREKMEVICETLEVIEKLGLKLTAAIHLSSGMCGRVTELALMSIRNTDTNPLRSYLFLEGRLACIPTHLKQRHKEACIARTVSRHPDDTTSDLFKIFALLLLPLRSALLQKERIMTEQTGEGRNDDRRDVTGKNFILLNRCSESFLSTKLYKEWETYGIHLTVSQFRQWCTGIVRTMAGSNEHIRYLDSRVRKGIHCQDEEDESDITNHLHKQAGHAVRTARTHYALEVGALSEGGLCNDEDMFHFMKASDCWIRHLKLKNEDLKERGHMAGTSSTT